jgi:hypothetical protein
LMMGDLTLMAVMVTLGTAVVIGNAEFRRQTRQSLQRVSKFFKVVCDIALS